MATDLVGRGVRPGAAACRHAARWPIGRWLLIAAVLGWFALLDPGAERWRCCARSSPAACGRSSRRWRRPRFVRAFGLTLAITALATLVNTVFGIALALVLVRQRFWGRALLDGVVDLPFAVSPVVAGLMLILLYGPEGWLGRGLESAGFRVIYAIPGMILATLFVTVPFVVRELVPVLRELGEEHEQAAYTLGAGRWRTFWSVTLPSIRWGVAYGVTLTVARSLGEFGAVLVVSGNLIGQTQTATSTSTTGSRAFIPKGPMPPAWCWPRCRSSCWSEWMRSANAWMHARASGHDRRSAASRIDGDRPVVQSFSVQRPVHQKETPWRIAVRHLSKRYGTFQAVDDVSFDVPAGQLVALLGPSGSGKSTILRIIAGLETAETGTVELTGEDATAVPIQQRGVGFVFQHYALFRHMTVRDNIAFGLKVRKLPKAEIRARVDELLDLVQLAGYAARYPSQLSGGQRQRVALARALAPRPKVLLLDEPFGALDAKVRDELRTWLRRLHDEVHVTSLFVTHDQQEAFEVADQVVVLNRGRIEQMGPPQELYERPATPFVTGFLGSVNVLRGQTCLRHGRPRRRHPRAGRDRRPRRPGLRSTCGPTTWT